MRYFLVIFKHCIHVSRKIVLNESKKVAYSGVFLEWLCSSCQSKYRNDKPFKYRWIDRIGMSDWESIQIIISTKFEGPDICHMQRTSTTVYWVCCRCRMQIFLFVEPATRESRGFKKCRNPIEYAGARITKSCWCYSIECHFKICEHTLQRDTLKISIKENLDFL